MNFLEERILSDGNIKQGNILKIDNFLNHQIDVDIVRQIAYSFTHKKMNKVFVSKPYLHPTDKVLIVDDFLAEGQAVHALIDLVHQAGGEVAGIGIAVEKGQQKGGATLREEGYRLESIAIIDEMNLETQEIVFRKRE